MAIKRATTTDDLTSDASASPADNTVPAGPTEDDGKTVTLKAPGGGKVTAPARLADNLKGQGFS